MGSNKRRSVADEYYNSPLFGQGTNNPAINRERAIYNNHMRRFGELAVNRFKWTGLPETVDTRFLEMCLYYHGLAVFYRDTDFDKDLAVRGSGQGYVNMLDNPVSFQVIGPGDIQATDSNGTANAVGFFNKTIRAFDRTIHDPKDEKTKELCIPIWANAMRFPDLDTVQIYSQRLAWLDRTLEINSKNARRNKLLVTTPTAQLSGTNVARSIDQGDELITITAAMQDLAEIKTVDLGILPDSYEKLSLLRTRVWNEAMGLFGIDNSNQDKKERLVAAEVGANDGQTDSFRFTTLNARRIAAEQISAVFGYKVEVEYHVEIEAREDAERAQKLTKASQNEKSGDDKDGE